MKFCEGFPRFCGRRIREGRALCGDCWRAKREVERETATTIALGRPRDRRDEYWATKRPLSHANNKDTIVREVLLTWGRDCHLCGGAIEPADLSFDHLIPRSKGGLTSVNNLRAAHRDCNVKRGNDPLSEWTVAA